MLLLHGAGANFTIRDMGGSTVAHMAASTNSDQSLRAIYSCFGEPSVLSAQTHNGATPAHVAAVFDNAEVCIRETWYDHAYQVPGNLRMW